jgi:hypothetical protein
MKKSFKLFLAAAFLVTEFFVIALPMLTTSARAGWCYSSNYSRWFWWWY